MKEKFQEQDIHKSYHRKCTKFTTFVPLEKWILSIIKNMNPITCSIDPCNTKFVLQFKNTILGSMMPIVNKSLTTGTFLEDWKLASVKPLIKGQILDPETNYRPISNLSFLSKITENTAQTQLQKYFDNQSLLPEHQSAYRQNVSTETTMLNMCDNILKYGKSKMYISRMPEPQCCFWHSKSQNSSRCLEKLFWNYRTSPSPIFDLFVPF